MVLPEHLARSLQDDIEPLRLRGQTLVRQSSPAGQVINLWRCFDWDFLVEAMDLDYRQLESSWSGIRHSGLVILNRTYREKCRV
ncbi:hypothetical protein EJ110_NYTH27511 [Nymphaea thermarum]|nr:hypothetical protein EJ110_NYTH27511 [Nymphaea thermarum]